MAKLTPSQEQELRDAFNLFDTGKPTSIIPSRCKVHSSTECLDHSQRISRSELRKVLHALNIKVSEAQVTGLMSQMDSDNSGEIDFNEFKAVMAVSFFKKPSRDDLKKAFEKFDKDGNGYISSQELSDILARMGRHLSKTDVEAIISSLDSSGDGKISFQEFCKLFD